MSSLEAIESILNEFPNNERKEIEIHRSRAAIIGLGAPAIGTLLGIASCIFDSDGYSLLDRAALGGFFGSVLGLCAGTLYEKIAERVCIPYSEYRFRLANSGYHFIS